MSDEVAVRKRRILTVCLGNHCRSPLAAVILTTLSAGQLEVRSAGLRAKWAGKPADAHMTAAAAEDGFDLSAHRGVQITREMIDWADGVLAMDASVLHELQALAGEEATGKLRLYLPDADVPDPFGQPYAAFVHCVALLRDGAANHLPTTR